MVTLIKSLWVGEVPLGQVFWWYAVVCGLLINLVTSILLLALFVNDAHITLLIGSFLLPIPYNLLVVAGVWRSANRYDGPKSQADLARIGCVVWVIALTAA